MLFEKDLTLLLRTDKALGRSLRRVGVFYCHTHRICVIPFLISFVLEFKAVSTGRNPCFAVAAKIYGDCAIWLGALGGGFSTANTLSVSRGAFQSLCIAFLRAGLWSGPPRAPGLCLPVRCSKRGGAGGSLGGQPVLWCLKSHHGHGHPEVQGGPDHLLRPLPRTRPVSPCLSGGWLSK